MILTVGHSTHPLDEFVGLLSGAEVDAVIDVRRLPGSRRYPWFDEEALSLSLPTAGIGYRRIAGLGGRRGAQRSIPDAVDAFWDNRSFHNYADYALGSEFAQGLEELIIASGERRSGRHLAIMCSEAVWWRCHRRIITDHLLARGIPVSHIMPDGHTTPAELTRGAIVTADSVEYPRVDSGE